MDTQKIEKIFIIVGTLASIFAAIVISWCFLIVIPVVIVFYLLYTKTITIKCSVKGLRKVPVFSNKITAKPNYIFAYGSLLNPESLLRTIERKTKVIEYIPCSLKSYSVEWINTGLRVNMVDHDWNSLEFNDYGALNLISTNNLKDKVNGAIIQVTNDELKKLKDRERNYKLKNITSDIDINKKSSIDSEIFTFISDINNANYFILRDEYVENIKKSLKCLGFRSKEISSGKHKTVKSFFPSIKLKQKFNSKNELNRISEELSKYLFKNNCVRYFDEDEYAIPSISLPLILSRKVYSEVVNVSEAIIRLSKKSFKVMENNDYLKELSGYNNFCFELATEDIVNTRKFPEVTRVDICLTKDSLKVFEVNTDSPGGMFHLDCLIKKQKEFLNSKNLSEKIDLDLLIHDNYKYVCNTIIDCFFESWKDFNAKKGQNKPLKVIAIVEKDWKMWSTRTEFEYFKKLLKSENLDADIYEPEELDYVNNSLIIKSTGKIIDLVYKRVLWNSFFRHNDYANTSIQNNPIFQAYKNNDVCMINSMNSWLLGNKLTLAIKKMNSFEADLVKLGLKLTEYEKKVIQDNIPDTYIWSTEYINKNDGLNNLDSYILKSFTGFGAQEIVIGRNNADTRKKFNNLINKDYIIQKKVNHGRSIIPTNNFEWENWNFIIGAYVVDGKCVGLEAKFAEGIPITMSFLHGKPVGYRTAVFPTLN